MTCIVGYRENKKVIIGGDSAGVAGLTIHSRRDPKVFKTGPFIMGFTSSFRMGQLLMSSAFKPPKQKKNQSDYDFMVTTFVDTLKECYEKGGFIQKYKDGDDMGGTFLVGYKGELYMVENDFQIAINHDNYMAVGCGERYAEGVMFSLKDMEISGADKINIALSAAAYFSGGVAPPFNYVQMTKKESALEAAEIKGKTKKIKIIPKISKEQRCQLDEGVKKKNKKKNKNK
jgi:ATP-dependent protease HslVU (ClpYQ) peptidase subunit